MEHAPFAFRARLVCPSRSLTGYGCCSVCCTSGSAPAGVVPLPAEFFKLPPECVVLEGFWVVFEVPVLAGEMLETGGAGCVTVWVVATVTGVLTTAAVVTVSSTFTEGGLRTVCLVTVFVVLVAGRVIV